MLNPFIPIHDEPVSPRSLTQTPFYQSLVTGSGKHSLCPVPPSPAQSPSAALWAPKQPQAWLQVSLPHAQGSCAPPSLCPCSQAPGALPRGTRQEHHCPLSTGCSSDTADLQAEPSLCPCARGSTALVPSHPAAAHGIHSEHRDTRPARAAPLH